MSADGYIKLSSNSEHGKQYESLKAANDAVARELAAAFKLLAPKPAPVGTQRQGGQVVKADK